MPKDARRLGDGHVRPRRSAFRGTRQEAKAKGVERSDEGRRQVCEEEAVRSAAGRVALVSRVLLCVVPSLLLVIMPVCETRSSGRPGWSPESEVADARLPSLAATPHTTAHHSSDTFTDTTATMSIADKEIPSTQVRTRALLLAQLASLMTGRQTALRPHQAGPRGCQSGFLRLFPSPVVLCAHSTVLVADLCPPPHLPASPSLARHA